MIKKIFISPYSMGYFTAFQRIDEISDFKIYAPDIRFNTFLYSSLMQTGANLIEIIDDPSKLLKKSKTINERVLQSNKESYRKVSKSIYALFSKYAKDIPKSNKKLLDTLKNTEMLIVDLLYSVERGSDLIFTGKIPDLTPYKSSLQPDIYYPLTTLLSTITTHDLFVPSPIAFISKSEINKFDAIIKSDIFLEYSEKHKLLSSYNFNKIADPIKVGAEKLVASNPQLLGIYNNLTSLIPLSKLISPQLGEIAEISNNVLANISGKNTNLVIYMYRDITLDVFKTKFDVVMNRFEADFLKWTREGVKLAIDQKISKNKFIPFLKRYISQNKEKKLGKL
jgi:hypothetical protein